MGRSWSEAARAAFDSYPWKTEAGKARAREEAELVAFGEQVEWADLPLAVRRHTRAAAAAASYVWRGESWQEATDAFARAILTQALVAAKGRATVAARLLKTTPRVVSYTARRLGLDAVLNGRPPRAE